MANKPLTKDELGIMQHAIGADRFGRGGGRNFFATSREGSDGRVCEALVVAGLMRVIEQPSAITGGSHVYAVTDEGRRRVAEESPKPPKLTRSQVRYREFLRCDIGVSFGEFLKKFHGKAVAK
jgi:hypothetical protein